MARKYNYEEIRTRRLIKEGFLPFEIEELKNIPLSTPYMKSMRRARATMLRNSVKAGDSKQTFISKVERMYVDMGYLHPESNDFDVWQLLRDYEDRYRARFPDYHS